MKAIKILLVALVLGTSAATLKAQDKIAYLNSSELIQAMPETDEAMKQLDSYRVELAETFEEMKNEYTKKLGELQNKSAEWSESMKNQKNKELQTIMENLQSFEGEASDMLSKKQQELMEPIIKKLKDAISAVGKEKGYTYIMDTSGGTLLYMDEAKSANATPFVKTKLGLK